jgi:hypothetical protein
MGSYNHKVDLNPGPGTFYKYAGASTINCLIKLTDTGSFLGATTLDDNSNIVASLMKINDNDDVIICGYYDAGVDFYPGQRFEYHNNNGWYDAFLLKLLPDGTW